MGILGIILAVLKIIGILILVLFLILLFLVLIVLLVPFVYRLELEKYDKLAAEGEVSWLFGLIALTVKYSGGEPQIKVLLLGRDIEKLFQKKKKTKKRKKKKRKKKARERKIPARTSDSVQTTEKTDTEDLKADSENAEKTETTFSGEQEDKTVQAQSQQTLEDETKKTEETDAAEENKVSPMYRRIPMKRVVQEEIIIDIEESKEQNAEEDSASYRDNKENDSAEEDIEEDIEEEKDSNHEDTKEKQKLDGDYFIQMPLEEKKALLKAVMVFVKESMSGVLPDSVYVDVTVGTGDPASTGYLLAGAGVLKGLKFENVNVRGKFDELFFEGVIEIEGRIIFVTFLVSAIRLILKKPIRKIIRIYWKGRGE